MGDLSGASIELHPSLFITTEAIEQLSEQAGTEVTLSDEALSVIHASKTGFDRLIEEDESIYGVTTGFGPLVAHASSGKGNELHGAGLIAHLKAGYGAPAPIPVVRATMMLRAHSLAKGYSAIDAEVLLRFLLLIKQDIVPVVPEIGSVGASGDLIPLAHIADVLTGKGLVWNGGNMKPAKEGLEAAGLQSIQLKGRDALALVNGTTFSTGYAALALARANRLITYAEGITGWLYRLLGCSIQALDNRLHEARGHPGQEHSAKHIREEAGRYGDWQNTSRPLQEIYSIRCAPQVLGACRDQFEYVRQVVEREANGISDNPVFVNDDDQISTALHGGNFQGQQIAFASDALNTAVTQIGVFVERQIAALVNPLVNDGAPIMLAWTPGQSSGLAGVQLTATALVAEMRANALPASVASVPTNGGNQDVVSMSTMAARKAYEQTHRLATILAVAGIALSQLNALRSAKIAPGHTTPCPHWMLPIAPIKEDRGMFEEMRMLSDHWLRTDLSWSKIDEAHA